MPTLTERLAACYSGAVHDVLRAMGHEHIVLPPQIKSLAPGQKLAGPVWTVAGHIDRSKSRHDCLLGWCTLLAKAPAGHVVVCQPHNHEVALMGELSAQTLAARGVLGYVVDGGSRDTDLVLEQGFPVFCSFLTPSDIVPARLTQTQIDELAEQYEVADVLPLTPLQQGLLFHTETAQGTEELYSVQLDIELVGQLDTERLHRELSQGPLYA